MTESNRTDEVAWWDQWNTQDSPNSCHDSPRTHTGFLAVREVEQLKLDNPSILEVGCGNGWLAEKLSGIGQYVGLDLAPAAVEAAKKRVPSADFVVADFHTWQAQDGSFDIVVMVDTIAYFRDQDKAVARARSLLKPGGWLVLTTVNPFVYSRLSWVGPPGQGQVRKWLTRKTLEDLLERNGFERQKLYTVLPAGDRGILRLLNSRKLSKLLFGGEVSRWYTRLKEKVGLGQFRVAVAHKRAVIQCHRSLD